MMNKYIGTYLNEDTHVTIIIEAKTRIFATSIFRKYLLDELGYYDDGNIRVRTINVLKVIRQEGDIDANYNMYIGHHLIK